MFHCVFHCAFHCVTQRRARFTVRFTAFHSAARISLQPRVCRGKFPISNAIRSSSGPVNLQRVCENHPSLERKACKRLTTSLLAQHYETLLRDGLRCRCLIITSNSNSVFSSRASCQNQAHQLGPPQYSREEWPYARCTANLWNIWFAAVFFRRDDDTLWILLVNLVLVQRT